MSGQFVGSVDWFRSDKQGAGDRGQRMGMLAQTAVTMLGGDVAVIDSEIATALATTERETLASPAQLANPLTALQHGFHAQISVPVRLNGNRVGTIAVLSRSPRNFDTADILALRHIAARISETEADRPVPAIH
ncbi:GAF domain-containing protein [Sphingomonas sp. RS6]